MAIQFACAPNTLFGYDILEDMAGFIRREKLTCALIVTDQGLVKAGVLEVLCQALQSSGLRYVIHADVEPNPTLENVEEGYRKYQEGRCDLLISLGGGSPTDCAKAIRMLAGSGGTLNDYHGMNKSLRRGPYMAAVNTTAGTASEISRAFLISDTRLQRKMVFKDDYAMPDLAVEDVKLMMKLPAHITAQTGMDALTHAAEGFLSQRSSYLTDLFAEHAMDLISRYLPKAVLEPDNREAREYMIYGQYLAGMCFGNAGVGLVHAMAHQLGAVYRLPHGLCNAILLPYVLEFYQLSGVKKADKNPNLSIGHIRSLSNRVGTDQKLRALGVKQEDFTQMAEGALEDSSINSAPLLPDKEEIVRLYESAW